MRKWRALGHLKERLNFGILYLRLQTRSSRALFPSEGRRVPYLVIDLGLVHLDCGSGPAAVATLGMLLSSKNSGTSQIQVDPTQSWLELFEICESSYRSS